jgi:hypothetical protein
MCYHLCFYYVESEQITAQPFTLQIDVDIGSSSVARSIIGLVLGYVTSIVVDLGILIEVWAYPNKKFGTPFFCLSLFRKFPHMLDPVVLMNKYSTNNLGASSYPFSTVMYQ